VPYFTAVLARNGSRWIARDLEVETGEPLVDVAHRLRAVAYDDEPVLLIVEHEDEWFALVRVDGEDDPRVFLSDVPGVASSSYAEMLGAEDVVPEPVVRVADDDDDGVPEIANQPAGDADVLADLGVPGEALTSLCQEGLPPAEALAEVSAKAGFEDLLDSLR
jgi:putative tRNA adenosine deaminase-associated protein